MKKFYSLKKVIAVAVTLSLVLSFLPFTAFSITSGSCGNGVSWSFDSSTGVFSVTGSGPMYDGDFRFDNDWDELDERILAVEIGNGVTHIGSYAFNYCVNLTTVTLPDSVKTIGDGAFAGTTSLKSLTLPDKLTKLGAWALAKTGLETITFPASVTDINYECMIGSDQLKSVVFENRNVSINTLAVGFGDGHDPNEGFTVYGYAGSTAEKYAKNYQLNFAFLGNASAGLGDINIDNSRNAKDSLLLKRHIAGSAGSDFKSTYADLNADNKIDSKDSLLLRRHLSGSINIDSYGKFNDYIKNLTIAGHDISEYSILISEDAHQATAYAANRLQYYIGYACGAKLEIIYSDPGTPVIEFIEDTSGTLGKDGYKIESETGRLTLSGSLSPANARGCLYVVYDLLEKYMGYKFYNDMVVVDEAESIDIPAGISETFVPLMENRQGVSGCPADYGIPMKTTSGFRLQDSRLGYTNERLFANSHSFDVLVDVCSPETQPCFTDPEIWQQCVDNAFALINQRLSYGYDITEIKQIAVAVNDNTDFCKCKECVKVNKEEGTLTGTMLRLVNHVADNITEVYPDIEIFTLIYFVNTKILPKITLPGKNVVVCICGHSFCNNHSILEEDLCTEEGNTLGTQNIGFLESLEKWCEVSYKVYFWYYNNTSRFVECPNVLNIFDDIQTMAQVGVTGYVQSGSGGTNNLEQLRTYLYSKMLWDPLMSKDEYLGYMEDYLYDHYGDAYEYILDYIYLCDEAGNANGCFQCNYDRPFDMYNKDFMAEHFEEFVELFKNAENSAKTQSQKTAVRKLSFAPYLMCLSAVYKDWYVNGSSETRELYVERYNYWYGIYQSGIISGSIGGYSLNETPMMTVDGTEGSWTT